MTELRPLLEGVRFAVFDFDGVFTDNRVWVNEPSLGTWKNRVSCSIVVAGAPRMILPPAAIWVPAERRREAATRSRGFWRLETLMIGGRAQSLRSDR